MRISTLSLPAKAVFSIAGLVLAAGLPACSSGDDGSSAEAGQPEEEASHTHDESGHAHEAGEEDTTAAFGHIHGLGTAEDVLYVATHYGLFTVADDEAVRVSQDDHDFMGFTMVDEESFLASGHPGSRTDLPANLGLLESTDGGRTWTDVSLSGEVDFHALDAKHGVVYGLDSGTGELMTSSDRENWERLGQVAIADVTISPENGDTIVVTTEQGPQISSDGGRTFERLDDAPVLMLMDWPVAGQMYGIGPGGDVHISTDDGQSWADGATLGAPPQAMTMASDGSIYVALEQSIVVSSDGGRTFSEFYTWQ